jgi:hypothetical protein
VGHVAWRDPRFLLSPRAALRFYGIDARSLTRREKVTQSALATATYASRAGGSVWASLVRAR